MTKIKAVLWDNDNTLVPTAENHFRKHQQVAKIHGVVLDDSHRGRIAANNGRQNWQWLSSELALNAPEDSYLAEIDLVYQKLCDDLPLNPGIREAIDLVKDQKILQCIMSNARRDSLLISVKAHDLDKEMAFVWGKEDYVGRKNEPATYKAATEALNLLPEDILFFDDDPHCVEAAFKAGISAVHVGNGPNPQIPAESFANLEDTGEIPDFLRSLI